MLEVGGGVLRWSDCLGTEICRFKKWGVVRHGGKVWKGNGVVCAKRKGLGMVTCNRRGWGVLEERAGESEKKGVGCGKADEREGRWWFGRGRGCRCGRKRVW